MRGWIVTALIVFVLIGAALGWRRSQQPNRGEYLPRTRALIRQKTGSLEAYNKSIPDSELLEFYRRHLNDRQMLPEAFTAMSELVTSRLLPDLWQESQSRVSERQFISHHAMVAAIDEQFPQYLLLNGDVVLFPEDRRLRVVVSEPPQDFFRDTGWHWRWMGLYLEDLPPEQLSELTELDIYAAEVLSEFLSVFGVALVSLADQFDPSDSPIDRSAIESAYAIIREPSKSKRHTENTPEVAYSHDTKLKLIKSLPKPMFRERTKDLNVSFHHRPNEELWRRRSVLEVPLGIAGGGVSSSDFDGDGYVDLYFAGDGGGRLYKNVAGKRFEDATATAGLAQEGESRAGYFIDYDNDGDLDLFITFAASSNRLYRNEGSGKFTDVTDDAGLNSGKDITHEAVWFDMDNDGLLDLGTANFGNWAEGAVPTIGRMNVNAGANRLYHHEVIDGKHVFKEVGSKFNVADRGWTHCLGVCDLDQDGYLDLFSLNDFGASLVYRNNGGKGFSDVSRDLHLDTIYNAMNFTLLDLDHSGHPAIYVSQIMKLFHRQRYRKPTEQTQIVFSAQNMDNLRLLVTNRLYRRRDDGVYEDVHNVYLEPAQFGWAWDASVFDYENDGDLELLVLNGTESRIPSIPEEQREMFIGHRSFLSKFDRERNACFFSEGGYFYDVSDFCEVAYEGNSRGSTFVDYDDDGDLDIVINDYEAPARIYENLQSSDNHWIRFKLEGTRSNRNAIGARLEIRFGDERRFDQVVSGSGFLSQNPMILCFGLGKVTQVDQAIITWPSGLSQQLGELAANQLHFIREPESD